MTAQLAYLRNSRRGLILSSLLVGLAIGFSEAAAQIPKQRSSNKTGNRSSSARVGPKTRKGLLQAKDRAWRSFFQNNPAAIEQILAPELIANQESQEQWEDRDRL